jgi:flavorubredoxin
MPIELFAGGGHRVFAFCDLVSEKSSSGPKGAVQCNQFLIIDDGCGALVDPGGNMSYTGLFIGIQKHFPAKDLDFILASHADPDIIASLGKWLAASRCKVLISDLWTRFMPHFTSGGDMSSRIVGIPDQGGAIVLGNNEILALPAHFLHAEGNFQFYDPIAKILFSGDLGAALGTAHEAEEAICSIEKHIPAMEAFHRRYMASGKACRFWAKMARSLDIEQIVPQHGPRFVGKKAVSGFIDWVEGLECGIDRMAQENYQVCREPLAA